MSTMNLKEPTNSPALPSLPSDLLEAAISDARSLDPRVYHLNMGFWHSGPQSHHGWCEVCLAGAVMAKRLGINPDGDAWPDEFDDGVDDKLFAIDALRMGDVHSALNWLSIPGRQFLTKPKLISAACEAREFRDTPWVNEWQAHLALVRELRAVGL